MGSKAKKSIFIPSAVNTRVTKDKELPTPF